ncbi:DUF4232 domain-containing protein [Kitasatospora sp. NPDC101801]|uniref:DUF4232 domain-containing protein n=1 Tax=Kitasatospora sp. NPDC101801 TaxID=3364103 RepID=UPI0037F7520B
MPSSRTAFPAVLAGALLLTGCGSRAADLGSGAVPPSERPPGAPSCGPKTGGAPKQSGQPALAAEDGVRITAVRGGCAEFEVTNHEAEPLSYLISFSFLSASGQAVASAQQAVGSVGPGRTVPGKVETTAGRPSDGAGRVKITKVRSVPSAEASVAGEPCPPSGTRISVDEGDAAMGLRVVGLHLENCGTGTLRLNGYPELQVLDEDHRAVAAVQVLHGGSAIASGTGADGEPEPLALQPGQRARAEVVWRNTVEAGVGDPVNAPYLRVRAAPGSAPMTVIPELDLGTTGRLGVSAWQPDGVG